MKYNNFSNGGSLQGASGKGNKWANKWKCSGTTDTSSHFTNKPLKWEVAMQKGKKIYLLFYPIKKTMEKVVALMKLTSDQTL